MNSVLPYTSAQRGRGAYPSPSARAIRANSSAGRRRPTNRPSPKKKMAGGSRVSAVGRSRLTAENRLANRLARNTRPRAAAKQANTSQAVAAAKILMSR